MKKKKVLYLRDGKGDGVWESARERDTAAEEERSLGGWGAAAGLG